MSKNQFGEGGVFFYFHSDSSSDSCFADWDLQKAEEEKLVIDSCNLFNILNFG